MPNVSMSIYVKKVDYDIYEENKVELHKKARILIKKELEKIKDGKHKRVDEKTSK